MNASRVLFAPLVSLCAITFFATSSYGQTNRTWDGGASQSDNWFGSTSSGNSGNRNWDGNTAVNPGESLIFAGTARLTPNNNTAAATSYAGITFASGTTGAFVLGGNSITLGGNVTNSDGDLQTINMAMILSGNRTFNAASGNITVGGAISGSSFGIIKTGNNTLTLNVSNTYTELTDVQAGTLFANNASGSAPGTGAVSVTAGTLGGSGLIAPTGTNGISVSGVLAPGGALNTIGTLTLNMSGTTGTVAMDSAASFEFQLGLPGGSIGSLGSTSDLLSLAGASASDFAFNNNSVNFLNSGALGYYKLFDTDSNNANTWSGLTVGGTGLITAGLSVSNLTSGLSGNLIMGGNSLGGTPGDIYLQVIPEPRAALLGSLGVLLLLRRRRQA